MAINEEERNRLQKRRDEIEEQLKSVNSDERIELDNDMEEQAIEMENHEVAVTMERNLRKELQSIEDQLLED